MPAPCPAPHRPCRRSRPVALRRVLAVVAALVLVGSACSGGDDETATTSPLETAGPERAKVTAEELGVFDIDTAAVAGPGTPLGGGLTVPAGTVLQGVSFPDLVGGGYRAMLLVTGDPVTAYNAVGEQAGGLNMVDTGGSCTSDAGGLVCRGRWVDPADGESLTLDLLRRVDGRGGVSGMGVRYRPPGSVDSDVVARPSAPTTPVAAVPLPAEAVAGPNPLDVGRPFRSGTQIARGVERGSELVGPAGPCGCDEPGWGFVAEITGVDRDVVAAYARQFADLGDVPDISEARRDDVTLLGVRVGEEGAPHAEIRAVVPDSGPAYLAVSVVGA